MLIQPTIIEQLPEHLRRPVQTAFSTLALSGVWTAHKALEMQKLLTGPIDESVEALSQRILDSRRMMAVYDEMQTLGLKNSEG